jgi:hypothetical protein
MGALAVGLQLASCGGSGGGSGSGEPGGADGSAAAAGVGDDTGGASRGGAPASTGGSVAAAAGDPAVGGMASGGALGVNAGAGHGAVGGASEGVGGASEGVGGASEGVGGAGALLPCPDDFCMNDGSCTPSETSPVCACADDFAGPRCERDTRVYFVQVSDAGASCGLTPDHRVFCWGSNSDRRAEPPPGEFLTLASGEGNRPCGVRADGALLCWGSDPGSPLAGTFKSVSVGPSFGCAIRSDDTLACWGSNTDGRATPPSGTFQQVAVHGSNGCALSKAGAISCWGKALPEAPPAGTFQYIVVGERSGCALTDAGAVTCWGSNLADPPSGAFHDLAAKGYQACGLRDDGSVECWGMYPSQPPPGAKFSALGLNAGYGISEDGTFSSWALTGPGAYAPGGTYRAVFTSSSLSCFQHTSGRMDCWGSSVTPPTENLHGVSVAADSSLNAGDLTPRAHGCGLNEQDDIVCFGNSKATTVNPPTGPFQSVMTGRDFSCALGLDGKLTCWGVTTQPLTDTFTHVGIGGNVVCGVREDSTLVCWRNDSGEVIPTPSDQYLDVFVSEPTVCAMRLDRTVTCPLNERLFLVEDDIPLQAFDVGTFRACGIDDDHQLRCWGRLSSAPSPPPEDGPFQTVSADQYTCAIRADRTRACWGDLLF